MSAEPVYNPDDTACPHGYLYPSVGGQTPCHVPNCGQDDQPQTDPV